MVRVSELPESGDGVTPDDYFLIVDWPTGTPTTKRTTASALQEFVLGPTGSDAVTHSSPGVLTLDYGASSEGFLVTVSADVTDISIVNGPVAGEVEERMIVFNATGPAEITVIAAIVWDVNIPVSMATGDTLVLEVRSFGSEHYYALFAKSVAVPVTPTAVSVETEVGVPTIQITGSGLADYFVDAVSGLDSNSGTTEGLAWKTLSKVQTEVNSGVIQGGDVIAFNKGDTFNGKLQFTKDWPASTPVTLTSYGSGAKPIINNNTGSGHTVHIYNCGGYVIDDLHVKNDKAVASTSCCYVENDTGTLRDYFRFTNLTCETFYDYGIMIRNELVVNTHNLTDIVIDNCTVFDGFFTGITTFGGAGGTRQSIAGVSDVTITNCLVYNVAGLANFDYSGNGIQLGGNTRDFLVEDCTVHSCGGSNSNGTGGPMGIWGANAWDGVFRGCVCYNMNSGTGNDGGAYDADGACENILFEHCLSYDNAGPGFLFFHGDIFGDTQDRGGIEVRFCMSIKDGHGLDKGALHLYAGSDYNYTNLLVHHNTFVCGWDGNSSPIWETNRAFTHEDNNPGYHEGWAENNLFVCTDTLLDFNSEEFWENESDPIFKLIHNFWDKTGSVTNTAATLRNESGVLATGISAIETYTSRVVDTLEGDSGVLSHSANPSLTTTDYQITSGSPCYRTSNGLPGAGGQGSSVHPAPTHDFFGNPLPAQLSIGCHQPA